MVGSDVRNGMDMDQDDWSASMRMVWLDRGWHGKIGRLDLIEKKDEHAEKRVENGAISEETRRIKRLM